MSALVSLLALLGFLTPATSPTAVTIATVEDRSISFHVLDEETGEEHTTVVGNRSLVVCLGDGDGVLVGGLRGSDIEVSQGEDGTTWGGDLEIVVSSDPGTRIEVRGGTARLGPVDNTGRRDSACTELGIGH